MYESLLRKYNVSVTQQRCALLEALHAAKEPVTIDFLKSKVTFPMDTSTIYRSLKTLVDIGLVYQTDFRDGVSYFEFHHEQGHHHHIVCIRCKTRMSIAVCLDEKFSDIEKKTDYIITNHMLEFFGICKNCL